ncbi:hypothetical protein [Nonomuraea sp. NPDC005501]|uniref:hypothetical protein n=1 Tax=Nonomuraea sp. NPDC005501 TaxID=3156884 RepID=UPI0033BFA5F1
MRPDMLVRRPVATGAFPMLIAAGVRVADLFITSQYLQHLRGYSALETGLFFLPTALATMVGAIVGGRLVGTIGTRPVAVAGLALVAIGNGLLIGLSATGNVYARAPEPSPRDNPADLIDVAVEELLRLRLELLGYTTLRRTHPALHRCRNPMISRRRTPFRAPQGR